MISRWYSSNHKPIISNACPPKLSQKSLRRKLETILLIVSLVGNERSLKSLIKNYNLPLGTARTSKQVKPPAIIIAEWGMRRPNLYSCNNIRTVHAYINTLLSVST